MKASAEDYVKSCQTKEKEMFISEDALYWMKNSSELCCLLVAVITLMRFSFMIASIAS
jgi:hypothetical protein